MNGCEQDAGHLAECLETLNQSLIELTAVFRVKRQVLAQADMDALSALLEKEEAVTEAIFDAESRRQILVEEIASASGAASERLLDIVSALPESVGDVLLEAGARLKLTMEALVREARVVAMICQAAVDHYEKLIRIVTGAELDGSVYTACGQKAAGERRSIIDQAI